MSVGASSSNLLPNPLANMKMSGLCSHLILVYPGKKKKKKKVRMISNHGTWRGRTQGGRVEERAVYIPYPPAFCDSS